MLLRMRTAAIARVGGTALPAPRRHQTVRNTVIADSEYD
jgi:hypothetical protein